MKASIFELEPRSMIDAITSFVQPVLDSEKKLLFVEKEVETVVLKSLHVTSQVTFHHEEVKHLVVKNTNCVILEFEGQYETVTNDLLDVRVFKLNPTFVKIIVNDTTCHEGDAKFELFALDGTKASSWLRIDSRTGLITGVPPVGVEKVVVQVKIVGKDGKIKTVDVEINVLKKAHSLNGTLSEQMELYASSYRNSTQLINYDSNTIRQLLSLWYASCYSGEFI